MIGGLNVTSAHWEIRTGVSAGNGGTLLFSGDTTPTVTPTGRADFGYYEYNVDVAVSFDLAPGNYWMSVVPVSADLGRSYNSNTFGLNAVGTHTLNADFFDSINFGASFGNANNWGSFSTFSSGVIGSVPEPLSLSIFGIGLAAFGALRRAKKRD
jgi:hypothetical protein